MIKMIGSVIVMGLLFVALIVLLRFDRGPRAAESTTMEDVVVELAAQEASPSKPVVKLRPKALPPAEAGAVVNGLQGEGDRLAPLWRVLASLEAESATALPPAKALLQPDAGALREEASDKGAELEMELEAEVAASKGGAR